MTSRTPESLPPASGVTDEAPSRISLPPNLKSSALLVFALTIFTGAFLLFQVQPLIGKFILPWFGGSPAVWTTCMLFFQTFLLAGYAYAHGLTGIFQPRTQAILHVLLMLAAVALLPITPSISWKPVSPENPTGRILTLLTVTLGLPYFVLSATGPLMQAWFNRLCPGVSPYRLYALSNAGSLLALITYPFMFEPAFTRQTQAAMWSWGLAAFAVLGSLCAACLFKFNTLAADATKSDQGKEPFAAPPAPGVKALWLGWAACASVLLLATTNKLCQDVAVIPFLWVLPLSLYLLSFIICFDSPKWYFRQLFHLALIPALGAVCYALFRKGEDSITTQVAIYSAGLFICCMVCHGELYRLKPHPQYLTAFYLVIAAGGCLGGFFVAILAPRIFRSYLELHWGLGVFAGLMLFVYVREKISVMIGGRPVPAWQCALAVTVALGATLSLQAWSAARNVVASTRNFYGVVKVYESEPQRTGDQVYFMVVGETIHGMQFLHNLMADWPTGYHHEQSGVGLALRHFPRPDRRRIGVVGLGVGTVAAYGQAGDTMRFYEINPEVLRLATNRFTYLARSKAKIEVVLGDARLSLENEPSQEFDVLALDAFNSDAVPVHLLTKEAGEIYLRHLKPDGVLVANITNRHLELLPVMHNLALHFRLNLAVIGSANNLQHWWTFPSTWVVLTQNQNFLNQVAIRRAVTEPVGQVASIPVWTDDYTSLFKILNLSGTPGVREIKLNQTFK